MKLSRFIRRSLRNKKARGERPRPSFRPYLPNFCRATWLHVIWLSVCLRLA